ncbi:hypothetical protein LCGC14_2831330, partial [marine sediment metagenome]
MDQLRPVRGRLTLFLRDFEGPVQPPCDEVHDEVGPRLAAINPEGIFGYQQSIDRWVNYAPAWERFMNLRNGVGTFSLGDVLVIPMGDGGAVTFDGYNVRPFDPVSLKATPNLHTTAGSFTFTNNERGALGTTKHWLLGATPSMSKAIYAGSDLRFKAEISSSFTDSSTTVRDANLATGATFTIGDSSDHIYIGWSRPFVGIHFASGAGALGPRGEASSARLPTRSPLPHERVAANPPLPSSSSDRAHNRSGETLAGQRHALRLASEAPTQIAVELLLRSS